MIRTGLLFIGLLLSLGTHAALTAVDDDVFGVASVTRDSATGLEWLDVPLSSNVSFSDVSTQFGPGGAFESWRHATKDELIEFLVNAGVPAASMGAGFQSSLSASVQALQNLVGVTVSGPQNLDQNLGFIVGDGGFGTGVPPAGFRWVWAVSLDLGNLYGSVGLAFYESEISESTALGHWLVREADPSLLLPSGYVLTDWKTAGDRLVLHNEYLGLEWLKWTESTNRSYDYISGQFGSGGEYEGWRYATFAEVDTLIDDFSAAYTSNGSRQVVEGEGILDDEFATFVLALGLTEPGAELGGFNVIRGVYGDFKFPTVLYSAAVGDRDPTVHISGNAIDLITLSATLSRSAELPGWGHALVRYIPRDGDSDGDGVPDDSDICQGGDDHQDNDGDLVPDYCDECPQDPDNDADGDGVCGDSDICAGGDDGLDFDLDGTPDFCDVCPVDEQNDADGDGICEIVDNCEVIFNPGQLNADGDEFGDACDADIDNDGAVNEADNCPFDVNTEQTDFDADGVGDACDDDFDGDNVIDSEDQCLSTLPGDAVDANGCSIVEYCPCVHPSEGNKWKNHGAYVKCVTQVASDFRDEGLLSDLNHGAITSAAADSLCGHN